MAAMSLASVVVTVALLVTALWALLRRALRATRGGAPLRDIPSGDRGTATAILRREAGAAIGALVIGLAAGAVVFGIGAWWPQAYGLPYGLAGGVGAIVGLAAFTLLPRRSWPVTGNAPVVAELSPRGPTSFARQWVFVLPAASAAALVVGLLVAGLASATDDNGLYRMFQRRSLGGWGVEDGRVVDVQYVLSSSGPFPGWYYGVPVMICTVLLVATVYWSLHRIARAPRPATADLFAVDTALRALRTRFVMTASSAALAFQVAGLALITGSVLRSAYQDSVPTPDVNAVPATVPVEPGSTLGLVLILSALVIAVVAVVLLARAIGIVAELWAAGSEAGARFDLRRQPAR